MALDLALALGATGTLLGLGSLTYTRAQAVAQRRQADEQQRLSLIELNRTNDAQVRHIRALLVSNPRLLAEYLQANPKLAGAFEAVGGLESVITVRNIVDAVHDAWHLRREGIVTDHYWRNWEAAIPPIANIPTVNVVFENAAARGAFDDDFVKAWRGMRDGARPLDPRRAHR